MIEIIFLSSKDIYQVDLNKIILKIIVFIKTYFKNEYLPPVSDELGI